MQSVYVLENYSQLKALSDPLRVQMMIYLAEHPYTGQQLAEKIGISRAKIHYHLRELEKNNLIELVRKEEKNGIMQKFYQSVARAFTPGGNLLPYTTEIGEAIRQSMLLLLERSKTRVLNAPEEAFRKTAEDANAVSVQGEARITKEQYEKWTKKYTALLDELSEMEKEAEGNDDARWYYVAGVAFHVDEPMFSEENTDK